MSREHIAERQKDRDGGRERGGGGKGDKLGKLSQMKEKKKEEMGWRNEKCPT